MRSKYIQAINDLGGTATALQIRDCLRSKGQYSVAHLVHNNLVHLRERGKIIKVGIATYSTIIKGA